MLKYLIVRLASYFCKLEKFITIPKLEIKTDRLEVYFMKRGFQPYRSNLFLHEFLYLTSPPLRI